jgi:hypothetical protein
LGEKRVTRGLAPGCFNVALCGRADAPKNLLAVLQFGLCFAPGFRARNRVQKCVPELLGPIFWSLVSVPESGLIFGPAFGGVCAQGRRPNSLVRLLGFVGAVCCQAPLPHPFFPSGVRGRWGPSRVDLFLSRVRCSSGPCRWPLCTESSVVSIVFVGRS